MSRLVLSIMLMVLAWALLRASTPTTPDQPMTEASVNRSK